MDNFNNKQIMNITGHKSSSSLEIYQKVNTEEKIQIGQSLAGVLIKDVPNKTCKRPVTSTVRNSDENSENIEPPTEKTALVTIPDEQDEDFNFTAEDILQIVEQCENSTQMAPVTNVNNNNNNLTMISNVVQERSPNIPSFNHCKIGSITINIQK